MKKKKELESTCPKAGQIYPDRDFYTDAKTLPKHQSLTTALVRPAVGAISIPYVALTIGLRL